MPDKRLSWLRYLCLYAGVLGFLTGCNLTVTPPPPSEPLVPTLIMRQTVTPSSLASVTPAAASATIEPLPTAAPVPDLPVPYTLRWRTGVGVPDGKSPEIYAWTEPRPGWYLNWSVGFTSTVWLSSTVTVSNPVTTPLDFNIPPDEAVGMEFTPMVRVIQGDLRPGPGWIAAVAQARPGSTWLIGNEPDVRWQDNATPEQYARAYHTAYTTIKAADPTAQVAIGGLSQITPLRLRYLDTILAVYSDLYGMDMPVDVWNMHAFVLQEKRNDWGVDTPPGFDDATDGMNWTIEEHDDLALVEEQVRRMRGWMQDHGQQDKPLWVTEYGILMPAEYGFDPPRVQRFLLRSFDLFNSLRDSELGLAADEQRLVQRWVWFSAGYPLYPTGNLFMPSGRPTNLMHAISAYLAEFGSGQ